MNNGHVGQTNGVRVNASIKHLKSKIYLKLAHNSLDKENIELNLSIRTQSFTDKNTIDTKRFEFLIKEFPNYFKYNTLHHIELKLIYAKKGNILFCIDIVCFIINLVVISFYIYEVILY
jgi:hypothetical protein